MKTKLIALNVLLAVAVFAVVWQAKIRWQEAQAQRNATLNVRIRAVTPSPAIPVPKPDAPPAAKYAEVANNNVFAADRNPTIVIDPPKVEAPKPMPHLPVVYGTMGLPSGTRAIMAEKPGEPSKSVRTGDSIGEFKVLALTQEKVTFEWDDKQIEKRIEDLIDRSNTQTAATRGPALPASPPAGPPNSGRGPDSGNTNPSLGVELTATMRACRPGDTAPAGTVVDGFKKQVTFSPFGATCRWVKQ